jgi:peptidoglycan LD-endopeptidase CwlK
MAATLLRRKKLFISIIIIIPCLLFVNNILGLNNYQKDSVIVDSDMTLSQSLKNDSIPDSVKRDLDIVTVYYYSFDNKLHKGQVVIRKELVKDITEIFNEIKDSHFPVAKVIPIVKYNWSDIASMEDNNSSAFNYRNIKGTKVISLHSKGIAIDINPLLNPQVKHGEVSPPDAVYDPSKPGTLTANSVVVKSFLKRGWQWGGQWHSSKDYQHFEKKIIIDEEVKARSNTPIPFKSGIPQLKKSARKHQGKTLK